MKSSNNDLLILASALKNYVVGAEGNVSEKIETRINLLFDTSDLKKYF